MNREMRPDVLRSHLTDKDEQSWINSATHTNSFMLQQFQSHMPGSPRPQQPETDPLSAQASSYYEADLKARDELVEILGKKLTNLEKDDIRHKNAMRSWKKKVQELERICRQLEKTVEDLKQESMERSVMDEASCEALRILHCQIATLKREKNEWSKREQGLREERDALKADVGELETNVTRLEGQEDERKACVDQLVRVKAEADVEIKTSRDLTIVLQEEIEQLRRHVHSLQQESEDKEVKIVQMTKQHSLDREDLQGLNIALDSKQRELDLLKRKNGVKGTVGSTPAQLSKVARHRRRESSIFMATPRPPSVLSDSWTDAMQILERKDSSEMAPPSTKLRARGKSTRVKGGSSSMSSSANRCVVRDGTDGSIKGPPPLKSRPSVGTPTPSAKGPSPSRTSTGPAVTIPTPHRKVSSDHDNDDDFEHVNTSDLN